MTEINDGGPAFPRPPVFIGDGNHADWWFMQDGMSRRDWLAGLAMQGIVGDYQTMCGFRDTAALEGLTVIEIAARTAYEIADAMIAEGGKGKD